jgi:uncharacterized protein YndB with AHSA1/START domain
MTLRPTGHLLRTLSGRDLVLTRTFRAPIDDVWASVTESERTARWFASWTGDAKPGATIRYRMLFEEGEPEEDMTILACDRPHHLEVSTVDDYGTWHLDVRLAETDGTTTLTFTHHLDDAADAASVGPGWEYYLDRLVSSRDGSDPPDFERYLELQAPYSALAAAV